MTYFIEFLNSYQLTFFNFLIAFLGAFLLGVGKAGIKGIGVLIVLLMTLVFGGKASTGVLIPLMVFADILAVIYYHKDTQWYYLKKLLPSMVLGVLIGVWLGNDIPDLLFKQIMAVLIIVSIIIMVAMEKRKANDIPKHWAFASSMGLFSGFTSMIGNLAGAITNIYFLAMRLPKNEFIGTAAWLFLIINVFKLPFHFFIWKTVSTNSLTVDLLLIPAIILGFFLGVKLVKMINNDLYRKFIILVTVIGAFILLFD